MLPGSSLVHCFPAVQLALALPICTCIHLFIVILERTGMQGLEENVDHGPLWLLLFHSKQAVQWLDL